MYICIMSWFPSSMVYSLKVCNDVLHGFIFFFFLLRVCWWFLLTSSMVPFFDNDKFVNVFYGFFFLAKYIHVFPSVVVAMTIVTHRSKCSTVSVLHNVVSFFNVDFQWWEFCNRGMLTKKLIPMCFLSNVFSSFVSIFPFLVLVFCSKWEL